MSAQSIITPIQRLSTGNVALDRILSGGIPVRSLNVIAGEPGCGKTILALQILFHLARQGKKSLYFTTLSEPAMKLFSYMQQFSFFDPSLLEKLIVFVDLGASAREGDPDKTLAAITDRVEREEPAVVVIDSFKAIAELHQDATRTRSFVYNIAVQMASWDVTTLLLGEYSDAELSTWPEFAVADGIVRLAVRRTESTAMREIDVLKLRGADFVSGRHFMEIGKDGVTFFPRVRAPDQKDAPIKPGDRVRTGIDGLDSLLDGGIPRTSATLVQGGTGTGKTLLGLQYLIEGARRGEVGILFTLEETENQIRAVAQGHGWDIAALEAQGLITLSYTSPVELSADRFLGEGRALVQRLGARRAVLDSLTSMALGVSSERRYKELVYALTKHFRTAGVTLMMTMEVPELLGSALLSGHGISFAADNVIQLRYVEVADHLERGISVLKARGVHHATEVRRATIASHAGLVVSDAYPTIRGVLTGLSQGQS